LDARKTLARGELAARVDGLAVFLVAVHSQSVEVLQPQTERVHAGVARGAQRNAAVYGEQFAHGRLAFGSLGGLVQVGDVQIGRWRRRRRAQEVVKHKEAAFDRRGSRWVG